MKCELAFRSSVPVNGSTHVNGTGSGKEKDKDKDSRTFVIGVETKAERIFVVLTVRFLSLLSRIQLLKILSIIQSGKSQTYATSDASVASTWVDKIKSALESHQQSVRT
jgi:hypothetical protein